MKVKTTKTSKKSYEMPVFSRHATRRMETSVLIVFIAIFFSLDVIENKANMIVIRILTLAGMIGFLIVSWCLNHYMEKCVWRLQGGCIRRVMFGVSRDFSYEEIIEALQTRKVKINTNAFLVPKGKGYIAFHYEVGNEKLQKEIKESYEFLAEKLSIKLPKLSQRAIHQMDRSFFYRMTRRKCSIIMLLASFLMRFVEFDSILMSLMIVGCAQAIQYSRLNKLFKAIYFGRMEEEKIQKTFEPYSNVKLRKVWVSYIQMLLMVLLTAALNLFWMFL